MKKKKIVIIIIVFLFLSTVGIILFLNNRNSNENNNSTSNQKENEYIEKCTTDAKSLIFQINSAINKDLNIPIDIKYGKSYKSDDGSYKVCFYVNPDSKNISEQITTTISYNDNFNYENFSIFAIADENSSIPEKTKKQMLSIWQGILSRKDININDDDRHEIIQSFFKKENSTSNPSTGLLMYEKTLNNHKFTATFKLADEYDEELKSYVINTKNELGNIIYNIDYLY